MTRKTLCIVIALMVLSIGAIIGANPNILGEFSSTLNGDPVQVTISQQDNGTITTMRAADLVKNWEDHDSRFVRFRGVVESVDVSESELVELHVGSITVYPLDAPRLPMVRRGHEYEFTGFFVAYNVLAVGGVVAHGFLGVYAFKIQHLGEAD